MRKRLASLFVILIISTNYQNCGTGFRDNFERVSNSSDQQNRASHPTPTPVPALRTPTPTAISTSTPTPTPPAAAVKPGYDIFIVAGQSNSVGYGGGSFIDSSDSAELNQNIVQLGRFGDSNGKVIPLTTKLQHWDCQNPADCGIGFAPTFARHYVVNRLKTGRKVLLIPAGRGGTHSFLWDAAIYPAALNIPGGGVFQDSSMLLTDLISRIRIALNLPGENVLKGLLWHQGESDVLCASSTGTWCNILTPDASTYITRLSGIFALIRAEWREPIPIVVGKFVPNWEGADVALAVKTQFENALELQSISFSKCVQTDGLFSNSQAIDGNGDRIHFSAQSQITLGQRYFKAYLELVGN